MIKNRAFALTFKICAAIVILFGIFDNFNFFNSNPVTLHSLLFYTIQSNVLVLAYFIGTAMFTARDLKRYGIRGSASYAPRFSMVVLVAITLTFAVFWFMLVPQALGSSSSASVAAGFLLAFGNLAPHLFVWVFMLLDYILFRKSGSLRFTDSLYAMVIPLFYFIQATILGFSGVKYFTAEDGSAVRFPYFFMDYDQSGGMVAVWVILLAALLFGLGVLLWFIDKKTKGQMSYPRAIIKRKAEDN